MRFRILIALGYLLAGTAIFWPAEVLAVGRAVGNSLHSAYLGHFLDKATFLVNCL
ncbi:MAG: hypothetical protein VW405_03500 [Rhodospirillaceae bacterium]